MMRYLTAICPAGEADNAIPRLDAAKEETTQVIKAVLWVHAKATREGPVIRSSIEWEPAATRCKQYLEQKPRQQLMQLQQGEAKKCDEKSPFIFPFFGCLCVMQLP